MINKKEPQLFSEVFRDLIERGEILPNLKHNGYAKN